MDDLAQARAWMHRLLEAHAGFSVLTAATIEEALRILRDTAVDVVVADLWLGERGAADGGNLLDAVARWHPRVVRIIATADPIGQTIARESGHLFYDKDQSLAVLAAMIRQSVPRA